MTWIALFEYVIALLGPLLAELLRDLFARTSLRAAAAPPDSYRAADGVAKLFAELRSQTWRWQFAKRASLAMAERIARNHAADLYNACRSGGPAPRMSAAERAEVEALAA